MEVWLQDGAGSRPLARRLQTHVGARLHLLAPVLFIALLFVATPAHAQFSWSLTKTASPATYSAAGQVITYSYVLRLTNNADNGNDPIVDISITDNRTSNATCPATTLAVGASMTCTGTYTITAADITAGSVINTATVSADICADGCIRTIQAQASVGYVAPAQAAPTPPTPPAPPATGSITIIKQAVGGNNTFNFTSTVASAASFTLATTGGSATRVFSSLTAGTYTFTEVNQPFRWRLASLTCTGDTGGTPTTVTLTSGSVSIGLDGGESITCVFVNEFQSTLQQQLTSDFIRLYLAKRLLLIAGDDTDRSRFFRRIPGSLWGDDDGFGDSFGSTQAFNYSGVSGPESTRASFSTSLSQMARAQAAAERRTNPIDDAFAAFTKAKPPATAAQPAVDVWVEAHYNSFWSDRTRLNNRGNFGIAYAGADILVTRSIMVGALAQFDWIGERSNTQRTSSDGSGYFVGPYIAARLTKNLFFDARAAWGQSDNRVNPFGLYEDGFDTTRWLARANLTGNWQFGQFRVTPSAGVIYISENQRGYIDTLGVPIPSQTVSLGRVTFGPEIGYRFIDASGATFEPQAALKASWDFAKPATANVGGYLISQDDVRLAAQVGLLARFASGQSWRVTATYDGIGSRNLRSIGGQLWLNVPLR